MMKIWYLILGIILLLGTSALAQDEDIAPRAFGLQWSADGRWIAANSSEGVWLFDVEDSNAEPSVLLAEARVLAIEFDPGSAYITAIVEDSDNETVLLKQIELETGEIVQDFMLSYWDAVVYDALYSHDGEKLLVSVDNSLSLFNPQTGERLEDIPASPGYGYDSTIMSFDQIANTGNYVVANNSKDVIIVNDEAGILETHSLAEQSFYRIYAIEHLEASNFLLHANDGIYRFNIGDESLEMLVPAAEENSIAGFAYSAESEVLVTGTMIDANWQLYDVVAEEVLFDFALEDSEVTCFSFDFNPDGSQFASLQTDGSIRIWDVETGEEVASWDVFERAFSLKWG